MLEWPISKQCNGVEFVSASENYAILARFVVIAVSVVTLTTVKYLSRSRTKHQT